MNFAKYSKFRRTQAALVLAVFSLSAIPCRMLAADIGGRFERYCDGVWFYLTTAKGPYASKRLELFFHTPFPPGAIFLKEESWSQVSAGLCSGTGKCDDASSARMWLSKGASVGKHISGMYEVDFGGQHFEGRFVAKEQKPTQERICE